MFLKSRKISTYEATPKSTAGIRQACSLAVIAATVVTLAGTGLAFGQDRLLGMVKPVVAKKEYRIGFASADMNADFFVGEAYGIVDEAKKANVRVVRILSAGGFGKVAEQVAQLEQLGSMGLDAVILTPAAYQGYDKAIERLAKGGTKVVTVGTPASSPNISLGILQDDAKIGATLANFICKKKPKATVITLPGPAGSEWNKRRFDGFQAAAAKCQLNLVGNIFAGNVALEDGQKQAADMLLKYPDADYLYAVAGIFSVGAAQEVKHMHAKPRVVTGTFTRRTMDLLKDGTMSVVISEPPIVLGRAAVQYAVRLLDGEELPHMKTGLMPFPTTFIPNVAVTADDIGKYDVNAYDLPPEGWVPPQLQ